ncbi:gamma-glutamylcyclotransferase family protein [Anaerobaca lacustris]|uniref:Putative gamma-glutamylcyclotransferase n=1 Tax=Anaerobaca lacustris TaxID=3044600 RepID=A0AAW6TZF1_9BACT|nr:gamma-glutamylcyclotransferase [Sedimentisphaerales bacterium M17dextr]
MHERKVNLFVYGSLRDSRVFQSVGGLAFTRKPSKIDDKTLFAEPAFLPGHRRVSPDNVYYYAVKAPDARIEGLVIYDVPASTMTGVDRYEGKRYRRETVHVYTAHGKVEAQAYLVTPESMRKHFGDRFHVNLIHELWLRKRINRFLRKHTRPGERTADAEIERQAERELLGTTERDLVMTHYQTDAMSDYYLEHELDRPRPSIRPLLSEPEAVPYLRSYLALVLRQVLLNQFDEQIQSRYRYDLEHMRTSERYFARSVSLLAALRMINASRNAVDLIVQRGLAMPCERFDLIDYVKYAVRAARSIFDSRVAEANLGRIRSNLQPGLVPLGFELELSNLGPDAVEPRLSVSKASDPVYGGFRYFYDFCLDVLCWKLGGYIDDHTGSGQRRRSSGFLEVAPGRLSIAGELSRPATSDPWLLNQLIHELVGFFEVRPHSLHLSFQLFKSRIEEQNVLPIGFVKCLLALGGGSERKPGGLWVSRMGHDEIMQDRLGHELVFARRSRRNWYLGRDDIGDKAPVQATTYIQQYKFIRLERRANYEPLILCLKGLQLALNPGDYLSAEQLRSSARLRRQYEQLRVWAAEPTQISPQVIGKFLNAAQHGLMIERHRKPAHRLHYIEWALSAIATQLGMFNQQVKKPAPGPADR